MSLTISTTVKEATALHRVALCRLALAAPVLAALLAGLAWGTQNRASLPVLDSKSSGLTVDFESAADAPLLLARKGRPNGGAPAPKPAKSPKPAKPAKP